jgi:glycosyltransferase involved in cell wall biosynthesis
MSEALVSVVMPVYQAARWVAEATQSILSQTRAALELIAVDDGSTDGSLGILDGFAARDPRVRVVRRAHAGVIPARNAGLALARGGLIACMDADDVSLPDRLARQVDALVRDPALVCVGGAFEVIDEKRRVVNRVRPPGDHAGIVAAALNGRSPICGSNAMFRRDVALALGGYDEQACLVEDLDLWLRLAERGRLANLPEVISRVRFHGDSQSALEQEHQLVMAERIANRARERRGIGGRVAPLAPWRPLPNRRSRHAFALGWALSAWRIGERRTALAYAARALTLDPLASARFGLGAVARRATRLACPR